MAESSDSRIIQIHVLVLSLPFICYKILEKLFNKHSKSHFSFLLKEKS